MAPPHPDLTERLLQTPVAAIINLFPDVAFLYDRTGAIVCASPVTRRAFALDAVPGYDTMPYEQRVEMLAPRYLDGRPMPREDWHITRILRGETVTPDAPVIARVRALDGQDHVLSYTGAPIRDEQGEILGAFAVGRSLEQPTQNALASLLAMAEAAVTVPESAGGAPMPDHEAVAIMAELTRQVIDSRKVAIVLVDDEDLLVPVVVVGVEAGEAEAWQQMLRGAPLAEFLERAQVERLRGGEVITLDLSPPALRNVSLGASVALLAPMQIGERLIGVLALDSGKAEADYTVDDRGVAGAVAQLAALVTDRERLVRERAQAEANELALREANRRMDVFLGVASHEMRTPLTTAKANLQILARRVNQTSPDGQQVHLKLSTVNQLLSRALGAVQRQERLVADLLDVSRIQEGKLELRLETADLVLLVGEVVDEMRSNHPDRPIALAHPDVERAVVAIDADRIRQVLVNYLDNAIKYSAVGQPVAVEMRTGPFGVAAYVRDFGPGLPEDELDLVWDRFYRSRSVETRSGSSIGLGLGLFISRTIVERHGGNVGVTSTAGQGSTFWFTLPLADESVSE